MSIHNIGFYEDLTKIVFELSSNIIKSDFFKKRSLFWSENFKNFVSGF